MRKRLIWADVLKGLLIVLVVLGHAIQEKLGEECFNNHLWNCIYSFHMAAFMAISGWLFCASRQRKNGLQEQRLSILYRRFFQLMVPFLLWSLIKILLYQQVSLQTIVMVFLQPDGFFWFLWVLFFIQVLFLFCEWLAEKFNCKLIITIVAMGMLLTVLMVLGEIRVFGFQFISYYFLFFAAGYYLHFFEKISTRNNIVIMVLSFLWAGLAWFWQMHELPLFLSGIPLPREIVLYVYRFTTALIAVYVLICMSPKLLNKDNILTRPLVWAGKFSLGIYVVHLLLIRDTCGIMNKIVEQTWAVVTITFIMSLVGAGLLVWILSKNNITSRYLLGKV